MRLVFDQAFGLDEDSLHDVVAALSERLRAHPPCAAHSTASSATAGPNSSTTSRISSRRWAHAPATTVAAWPRCSMRFRNWRPSTSPMRAISSSSPPWQSCLFMLLLRCRTWLTASVI